MEDHQFRRASVNAAVQEPFELTRETLSDGSKSFFSKTAMDQPSSYIAVSIVVLSCILYIPFLRLPLLPDDYMQITLGRKFGPIGEGRVALLLADALLQGRLGLQAE